MSAFYGNREFYLEGSFKIINICLLHLQSAWRFIQQISICVQSPWCIVDDNPKPRKAVFQGLAAMPELRDVSFFLDCSFERLDINAVRCLSNELSTLSRQASIQQIRLNFRSTVSFGSATYLIKPSSQLPSEENAGSLLRKITITPVKIKINDPRFRAMITIIVKDLEEDARANT